MLGVAAFELTDPMGFCVLAEGDDLALRGSHLLEMSLKPGSQD
jgi:hypothetical protein